MLCFFVWVYAVVCFAFCLVFWSLQKDSPERSTVVPERGLFKDGMSVEICHNLRVARNMMYKKNLPTEFLSSGPKLLSKTIDFGIKSSGIPRAESAREYCI